MDEIKQTKIVKKSLKVAVNEPEALEPTNELIEAPKVQKLTRKGVPDTRGKTGKSAENLAKGRAKLEEVWAEKRKLKEQYESQALERKMAKELKLKKQINKQYNVESESEEEQEEEAVVEQQLIAKKIINAPKKEVSAKQDKIEQREKSQPKKKVIKYVEVESESEEEEIVYVKRQNKPKVSAPVVQQPVLVQQQGFPRIQFF
jgi:hypothetical protein